MGETVAQEGKRELLDIVKARKLAYYGRTTRKQASCLAKEILQGTMPGARRRGRPHTVDNIKTWTEDIDNGESTSMVWPTVGSRTAKEQNRRHRKCLEGECNPEGLTT